MKPERIQQKFSACPQRFLHTGLNQFRISSASVGIGKKQAEYLLLGYRTRSSVLHSSNVAAVLCPVLRPQNTADRTRPRAPWADKMNRFSILIFPFHIKFYGWDVFSRLHPPRHIFIDLFDCHSAAVNDLLAPFVQGFKQLQMDWVLPIRT